MRYNRICLPNEYKSYTNIYCHIFNVYRILGRNIEELEISTKLQKLKGVPRRMHNLKLSFFIDQLSDVKSSKCLCLLSIIGDILGGLDTITLKIQHH